MRTLLACSLAALVFGSTLSADEKKDEKIDAKKLIGKWEPKEKKEGTTVVVEFLKDGKLKVAVTSDGKDVKLDGTYKLEGNKLSTTLKFGEKEQTKTMTVSKLTDTELVSADEKGKEEAYVRIKDK